MSALAEFPPFNTVIMTGNFRPTAAIPSAPTFLAVKQEADDRPPPRRIDMLHPVVVIGGGNDPKPFGFGKLVVQGAAECGRHDAVALGDDHGDTASIAGQVGDVVIAVAQQRADRKLAAAPGAASV